MCYFKDGSAEILVSLTHLFCFSHPHPVNHTLHKYLNSVAPLKNKIKQKNTREDVEKDRRVCLDSFCSRLKLR